MTVAVCFNCGEFKWGALTLCKRCNAVPISKEEAALSVVITDQCLSKSILNQVSMSIKNGKKVELSSELLREWVEQIEDAGILNETD